MVQDKYDALTSKLYWKLRLKNSTAREALAEFLGVFILIAFGNGSVAQLVLGRGEFGGFLSVNWGWGLGVCMAVFVSGGVSGGHINPAVSLTLSVMGRLVWRKLPLYMFAQYMGAFVASACVYWTYFDALNNFDGGNRTVTGTLGTAGIWSTYPKDYVSVANGLGDQILGTALLMTGILAITDKKNMGIPSHMTPVFVGLLVHLIGVSFGLNCGYAINPARDLGPRIFTSIAGWGVEPFSFREYSWFWVPVVGPHIGALLGAIIYQVLIGVHLGNAHKGQGTAETNNLKGENSGFG